MQDTFARATHSAAGRPSAARDDRVSCIQISARTIHSGVRECSHMTLAAEGRGFRNTDGGV